MAALPALPFLLEILDDANEELTVEILDILTGFASCSREGGLERADWIGELRTRLLAGRTRLERLAGHSNNNIANSASNVLEELGPSTGR